MKDLYCCHTNIIMMKKEEFIRRCGKVAYEKQLQQRREYSAAHRKEAKARLQEQCRKGGKYYEQQKAYNMRGLQHERRLVRVKHRGEWAPFKRIIAPDSQIHHEWIHETADYRGVALVEADQHMHGYIDVIQILDGEITLLTEEEVGGENTKNEYKIVS